MDPLYLFGSGTSPLPKVSELTTRVLEAKLFRHTDDRFGPDCSNKRNPPYSAGDNPEFIRRLLTLIRQDIAIYQERNLRNVSYEDIADICDQLDKNGNTHRNPALQPYSQKLRDQLCTHFPKSKDQIIKKFDELLGATMPWIRWAIYHEFIRGQNAAENDLHALKAFHDKILRRTPQATIVTLNHDTLLENVLGENINLGFATDASGEKCFHPTTLAENHDGFKVLKLHGSIDWFYNAATKSFIREPLINRFNTDGTPLIICGTISKLETYNFGISPWLWADFQNSLRATRRIIISGYGFKDLGVNVRLRDWLKYYPDARLVIIHPDPKELATSLDKCFLVGGVQNFLAPEHQIIPDFKSPFTLPTHQISFIPAKFENASAPEIAEWITAFAQAPSPA